MKKKAIRYTILFLIVPLILSLSIAIVTDNKGFNNDDDSGYDGLHIPEYDENNKSYEIKRSSKYTYISVFTFVAIGGGVLIYIKHKREI